jgi:cytochrome-b5 reductase
LDWINYTNKKREVGQRMYTREELRKHNSKDDAWMAIRGLVYDVTEYMKYHPGGPDELM